LWTDKDASYFMCKWTDDDDPDCTAFKWKSDSNDEVTYYYSRESDFGAYKLWKEDCDADGCPGVYMVYQECTRHSCWLNFHCVQSYTGDPYDDC
jgi:hypothetical protein